MITLALCKEAESLQRLMHGERIYKPPFWEVWFGLQEFFTKRYGEVNVPNRIRMAQDLGMAIVCLGGININAGFHKHGQTSAGVARYCGGSLTSLRQLEERELPNFDKTIEQWKHDQGLIRDAGLISWVVVPWCFHVIATSMGLRNFAIKLHKDYDFVDRAFEWVEERSRMGIDTAIKEARPDVVLFDGDCAYQTGLMVHPAIFRRLVLERTEETLSHLRPLGIPYALHTDGKLDDVIPLLLELGFSAVHGCEKAANDLGHLVEKFGDEIVLVGNMDVTFLYLSTHEQVRRETNSMLDIGSRKGKFVAACNTRPLDNIPQENYLAMVQSIKEFSPHARRQG
jgi:uroporphyrinogen decarboxylase